MPRSSVLLLVLLASLSLCCSHPKLVSSPPSPSVVAPKLEDATTALVNGVDPMARLYCSAVWVSHKCMITAEHCVADLGMPLASKLLHAFGLDDDTNRWDPTGQPVQYSTKQDLPRNEDSRSRDATVLLDDYKHDLALLMADEKGLPEHAIVRVSTRDLLPGDVVYGMGHPGRYGWSFALGYVSAFRPAEPNADDHDVDTLQLQIPISPGNSGGGAYDAWGDLIGIASYHNTHNNGMGMYIAQQPIRNAIAQSGCGQEL